MKKSIFFVALLALIFILTGCDGDTVSDKQVDISDNTIDYNDANTFENALNEGVKVKGKIARIRINDYAPDSILGINCHAGEHLNFISQTDIDVEKGDTIVVRVKEEPSKIFLLGSWKIYCEVLSIEKNTEDTEETDGYSDSLSETNDIIDEELEKHFENNSLEKIKEIDGLSVFNLTATYYDEDFKEKPLAVLFFTIDSIYYEINELSSYEEKIKAGGCVEVYSDIETAKNRNSYLKGYYFFGLSGYEFKAVNNYVIQISKKLSKKEQDRLIEEISCILLNEETTSEAEEESTEVEILSSEAADEINTEESDTLEWSTESTKEVVGNPYNKLLEYEVYTKTEYAHIDTDIIRLGSDEKVWITIETSQTNVSLDDFILDYDDTMIEIITVKTQNNGSGLNFEIAAKAKKEGLSEIVICSCYEMIEDYENASYYVLTIQGLNSFDGRVVYVTSTGEKYHYSSSCAGSSIKTTLSDALAYEYEPCGKCAK